MSTVNVPNDDVHVVVRIGQFSNGRQTTVTVSRTAIEMMLDTVDVPEGMQIAGMVQGRDLEKELIRQALLPIFHRAAWQAAAEVAELFVSEMLRIAPRVPKEEK